VTNTLSPTTNGSGPSGLHVLLDVDAIPQELRNLPQWVTWRIIHRRDAGKPTKLPLNPRTGEVASSTDPTTWGSFDEALSAFLSGSCDGIGFVFSPDDPYVGVDLDGCYDPESGILAPWAQGIVSLLSTYTELSPSGRGLHLILRGQIPGLRRRQGPIEMYSEGRFFTMTGCCLEGTHPDIAHRAGELQAVYHQAFGQPKTVWDNGESLSDGPSPARHMPDDDDLVQKARGAKNGTAFSRLWHGDCQGYASQSEADLALCSHLAFWTGSDAARMDQLFRRSGLFRPKWDEKHGSQTYGQLTIAKALSGSPSITSTTTSQGTTPFHDINSFPLTDAGNAELFAHLYGHQLRYDYARSRWLLWEGHRWAPDTDGEVYRLVKEAARTRYQVAAAMPDLEQRRKAADFAVRSESRQKLEACLALAQSEHPITDSGAN
jgi:putative DNA primase/helicase